MQFLAKICQVISQCTPSGVDAPALGNPGSATITFTKSLLGIDWVFREEDKHIKEYVSKL